ncbi:MULTISPECIES: AraC family transcriptional regulator [Streptomyces]|uniref:AraC family transcriptional regulator n=1 Tax=Streptomyces griseiscabiei TaxID=2993540 RepID=A0ABU4KW28_9ACTN|nr:MULTISPECIES: AraC family transcriptional regulator [Streptomyces]MBZ3903360.1 AraC family transcriptional regulator [Streptomyces griseiscabiei]MDX2907672.1 AraC family transcriptional regulator [Streptomyces griseiscabiei]
MNGSGQTRWTRTTLGHPDRPLDLLTARFDSHRYAPHTHEEFSIGICVLGASCIDYRGGGLRVGEGSIVVLAPGEVHTGESAYGTYAYRALYPAPTLLTDGVLGGTPHFREPLLHDPELAAALRIAHTELSTCPDPLEAESRLPWLLTALARRHSTSRPTSDSLPGANTVALAVRDRLADELATPPSLADLASDLGLSRYQLLRAFRTTMGMPPYAWLAQHRVARARGLLEAGARPAEAAVQVGFADQAHMTRWFGKVLGVTPAAYRNSVQDAGR